MTQKFRDRADAGRRLAAALQHYAGRSDVSVLALPRGGVPVAYEVAQALRAPLDIFVVRKLGVPGQPELAMGAIATGGVRVLNCDVVMALGIPPQMVDAVAAREGAELGRRERAYRGNRPVPDLAGRTVILVDDGLAHGSDDALGGRGAEEPPPCARGGSPSPPPRARSVTIRAEVDEVVCAETPPRFGAVGMWYDDFRQTSDEDVRDLLKRAAA